MSEAESSDSSLWDESKMDKPNFFKYNVHEPFQKMDNEKTKEISKRLSLPISLCLLNFDGNSNIAMSIRTAAVIGAESVYVVGKRKYDKRATVGAHNYVQVKRHSWIDDPCHFFEEEGVQPICIEQGGQPLEEFNFKPYMNKRVVFIMGSEGDGVDKTWIPQLKAGGVPFISIAQCGLVRSFNVTVAASIVMYEYCKQRRKVEKDSLGLD